MRYIFIIAALAFLASCSNKSATTTGSSNTVTLTGQKPLASCTKSSDSNFSFNTAAVFDQSGMLNTNYLKLKFNFLNANITKSGNVIKFFKWKATASGTYLDPVPLNVASYDFSTGQTNSNSVSSIPATQLNGQYGLYIELNDPSQTYQVLMMVAYDSSGTLLGKINTLIPQFAANPADYAFYADGSPRVDNLKALHPLNGSTVTRSSSEFTAYFNQYCF